LDLGVRQHEESPQQRGRVPGVHPDLGEDPPVLQLSAVCHEGWHVAAACDVDEIDGTWAMSVGDRILAR
ncbi:hypothetical protein ACWEQN_43005, partial [Streptomyces sp. NPDC004129]